MDGPPTSTLAPLHVDQWLFERKPALDLTDMLVCAWRGNPQVAEIPPPDECLDLIWIDDGSMWLSGPETRSWTPVPTQRKSAVGIRFQSGIGPPILGLAASGVLDARIRLDLLWGDRRARELAERIAVQRDDRARMRELEGVVRRLLVNAPPVDEVARAVADMLSQCQSRS